MDPRVGHVDALAGNEAAQETFALVDRRLLRPAWPLGHWCGILVRDQSTRFSGSRTRHAERRAVSSSSTFQSACSSILMRILSACEGAYAEIDRGIGIRQPSLKLDGTVVALRSSSFAPRAAS